jgi:AMP-polyphosphate phosphotransferase
MGKKKDVVDLGALEKDTHKLSDKDYEARLDALQKQLMSIQEAYLMQQRRALLVFEGTDAAGKGGTIRRLMTKLDPRFCKVWPIAAPTQEERSRHYLARFFARLPAPGTIAVFDRSWYGRVLVERVEGLIDKDAWSRAYDEIVDFERMLTDDGAVLVKIYLHIGPQTQARRFVERISDPLKRWKITPRDFEARRFFDQYRAAAEEMIRRTATKQAPWTALPGENKRHARIAALETIVERLSHKVDLAPPPLDRALCALARKELGMTIEDGG